MHIIFEKNESGIAKIILHRPQVFNSFNREMALEVQAALDDCEADKNVRVVILTGSGKAFCAGQDLAEVTNPNAPSFNTILQEHYNPIVMRLRNIAKPILAAVNGVAAGAGANLALACDIVVAAESASFIQAFSKIGLIPDSGGTFTLPRLVGFQKASALMMLGDKIMSVEAERLGMIYKFFADDIFVEEVEKIAQTLSQMPTLALGFIKRALNESLSNNLSQQLAIEDQLQFKAATTADYREGVAAFMAKRKPIFRGE